MRCVVRSTSRVWISFQLVFERVAAHTKALKACKSHRETRANLDARHRTCPEGIDGTFQDCRGGWLNFVSRGPMQIVWRPFPQASCSLLAHIPFHLAVQLYQLPCKLGGALLTCFASATSPVKLPRTEDGAKTDTTFMSTKAALNACPTT